MRHNKLKNHHKDSYELISPLFILILLVLGGTFLGQFFGTLIVLFLTEVSLENLDAMLTHSTENANIKNYLLILKGAGGIGGFVVAPLVFQQWILGEKITSVFHNNNLKITPFLVMIPSVFLLMIANSAVIEWNNQVDYGWISEGFAEWARAKENELQQLNQSLTTFDSFGSFLGAFFIIALVAAFGEEYIFRSLIQPQLQKFFRNPHLGIWITAILFSAIHLEFYGFVPRLLLGVVYGYLFYWSGNIVYPIIAHFLNNGFIVVVLYLQQKKLGIFDINSNESLPVGIEVFVLVAGLSLFVYFKSFFKKQLNSF